MRPRDDRCIYLILLALSALPALAHQPFFEDEDITAETPWLVAKPTVSTAIYATLDSRTDVDYHGLTARRQTILLSIVIPQIAGQELRPDHGADGAGSGLRQPAGHGGEAC